MRFIPIRPMTRRRSAGARSLPGLALAIGLASLAMTGCATNQSEPTSATVVASTIATTDTAATTIATSSTITLDAAGTTAPPASLWRPAPGTTWQWQLTGEIDITVEADMYDIDLFDVPAATIDELHAQGRIVVCYLSAGAWEGFRPDASAFPEEVLGKPNGWEEERWLDIRAIEVLAPIIEARMDLCRAKGFDGVEADNVDGYANDTGFPLTAQNQLAFNTMLAEAAHARGLSIGLKNDVEQAAALEPLFDWAINEQCATYDECEQLLPFIAAGKAVFHVEYDLEQAEFCPHTVGLGFSSMRKRWDLDAWRQYCPDPPDG